MQLFILPENFSQRNPYQRTGYKYGQNKRAIDTLGGNQYHKTKDNPQ